MDQSLDVFSFDPSLDLTPSGLQTCTPARQVAPSFPDLIAASLREACEADGDALFPIIARLIDQHIAGTGQTRRVGRWRDEALDELLSVISPGLCARIGAQASAN
ncbi:hypothetical protein JI752_000730 [Lysobacter sp. MMG2]|uniref:hypothetical protein n=1 Tax=Lysobacter sp. MMG2 TaxID=2801338 RepID=UPI001C22658C|nr:hypothetical protein [Lysobacter sp. MMG2]MBU8974654.1 hypothetical protein [Lysobacter sp. MMG2]